MPAASAASHRSSALALVRRVAFVLVGLVDLDLFVDPAARDPSWPHAAYPIEGGLTGSVRPTENSAGALARRASLTPSRYDSVRKAAATWSRSRTGRS